MTTLLFVLTGVSAVADGVVVSKRLFRLEYLLKPLTQALLIAAAATADLPVIKGWIVGALVLGLVGDIALMLASDDPSRPDGRFLLGLAAFLGGHICYLAAFARYGVHCLTVIAGLLVVIGSSTLVLPRVLVRVHRAAGPELMAVVAVYSAMLAAMTVLAVGTGSVLTAAGGLLFLASDTTFAWGRYVHRLPKGDVAVAATYHAAQLLIVLGLVQR